MNGENLKGEGLAPNLTSPPFDSAGVKQILSGGFPRGLSEAHVSGPEKSVERRFPRSGRRHGVAFFCFRFLWRSKENEDAGGHTCRP
jgi:hypothetical protein